MKPQEILLASSLIAVVVGASAAFAVASFRGGPVRGAGDARPASSNESDRAQASSLPGEGELERLRSSNVRLEGRLTLLENRLAELSSLRAPLEVAPEAASRVPEEHSTGRSSSSTSSSIPLEVTPAFVASVGEALDVIQAKQEAEREAQRKEQQALRIEERVTKLQQELGLSSRQSSDLRTTLIAQDDRREKLFATMRDGTGEPQDIREGFRSIRDETHSTLQTFLTPDQFTRYTSIEDSDFGRRGDFGGPGGPGFGGPGGRSSDGGRRSGR